MMQEVIPAPQFPVTRWSVVLTAVGPNAEARLALEELCRLYWFPLYAFARQQGCGPEDAEDQTQEFLARIAEGKVLPQASPERGKLRTYLLKAFERDLIDAHRKADRIKRGRGYVIVPLDHLAAEDRFQNAHLQVQPSMAYDRAWALACLDAAVQQLEAEYAARGRSALFTILRPFLDPDSEEGYASAGESLGLDQNAIRQAVFRLRQRFRVVLRQSIADTLDAPTEMMIDDELTALRVALQR